MKPLISLFVFAMLSTLAYAKAAGNYVQYSNFDPSQMTRFQNVTKLACLAADNIVEIRINALHNKKASSYVAVFNIIRQGRATEEANNLLNSRLNAFVNAVKALGIPPGNVHVDMVNFLPKYEIDATKKLFSKKTYTEVPKDSEIQKNVHIRYADPTLLDKVAGAAAVQEIFNLVRVDYFDASSSETYEDLRWRSFDYLAKIKSDFRSAGIALDSTYVIAAENTWGAFPGNRYESYQAHSTQAFEPINKSATVTTLDKPISRFYTSTRQVLCTTSVNHA